MYQEEEDDSKLQDSLISEGGTHLNLYNNFTLVYFTLPGNNPHHHHDWPPFPNIFLLSLAEDGI